MNLPHSDLHVPQGRTLCPFCTPREPGMGELFPVRSVQGRVQRGRPPCMGPADALDAPQVRGQAPARDARDETPLLRPRLAVRPGEGRVHRRLQRHRDALPLSRKQHPDPLDPETSSRRQRRRLTGGKDTWSARCLERGTPGAGGGLRETDGGNTETAPAGLPHPPPGVALPCRVRTQQPSQSNISRAAEIKELKIPSEPLTDIGASIWLFLYPSVSAAMVTLGRGGSCMPGSWGLMPAVPARTCGTPGCSPSCSPEGPSGVPPCGR